MKHALLVILGASRVRCFFPHGSRVGGKYVENSAVSLGTSSACGLDKALGGTHSKTHHEAHLRVETPPAPLAPLAPCPARVGNTNSGPKKAQARKGVAIMLRKNRKIRARAIQTGRKTDIDSFTRDNHEKSTPQRSDEIKTRKPQTRKTRTRQMRKCQARKTST